MDGMLNGLGTTEPLADVFSDRSLIEAMLAFEVGLARAEARTGVIPPAAAKAIETAAAVNAFVPPELARSARRSGTLSIPLVARLRELVRTAAPDAAAFVHRGATSQDLSDTALVLCLRRASGLLSADHGRLVRALYRVSEEHAHTLMLARTLLQPAQPTTFGLKAAGWFGAASRSWREVSAAFDAACVLQFGGAAGTLAALGPHAHAVSAALGEELDLAVPDAPWHAHRDRLARVVTACGIYTGVLGKIARDVSLLMQSEVAEAAEPGGSSSTMPHKRNPAACAIALAAATRVPGLVAAYLAGLMQEHERGLGNWHAEMATIADVVQSTGAAVSAMTLAIEHLQVDPVRMRQNVDATRGVIFAERAMLLLAPLVGSDAAEICIREAIEAAASGRASFVDALFAQERVRVAAGTEERERFGKPDAYLGAADDFRRRLLKTPE